MRTDRRRSKRRRRTRPAISRGSCRPGSALQNAQAEAVAINGSSDAISVDRSALNDRINAIGRGEFDPATGQFAAGFGPGGGQAARVAQAATTRSVRPGRRPWRRRRRWRRRARWAGRTRRLRPRRPRRPRTEPVSGLGELHLRRLGARRDATCSRATASITPRRARCRSRATTSAARSAARSRFPASTRTRTAARTSRSTTPAITRRSCRISTLTVPTDADAQRRLLRQLDSARQSDHGPAVSRTTRFRQTGWIRRRWRCCSTSRRPTWPARR